MLSDLFNIMFLALSASVSQHLPSSLSSPVFEYIFFFLFSLQPFSPFPAPDHSRSEMDLSAPGSEPSDDALSLRSRSVPGLNETVSVTCFPSSGCVPTHSSLTCFLLQIHCHIFKATHLFLLYDHIRLRVCGLADLNMMRQAKC